MSITLTSNYRETLAPETLSTIDRYVEDNYDLSAMLIFIDEYSEETFQEKYSLYVELGEDYGYEAVDAFLTLTKDADELDNFGEAFIGVFLNPRDMAEQYFDGETDHLDYRISIDWSDTADYLLAHDVDRVDDYYFRCSF